ncbi:MAG: hypothetical protein KBT47_06940 [Armatimonadetes bacterium]|nr:hypothetical protein [Candidatus Hippobium faecium]
MKKTYILIFLLLCFAVSFFLINRLCEKMISSGDSMPETEMTDVNLYFFDYGNQKKKDYLLFDFNADKCFLSHNFRNFSAENIE